MGGSDADNHGKDKDLKVSATTQEFPSTTSTGTVNPDWSGFQAYSPMPPHGFLASGPQAPHPYMWGVQPLMPPYGTPPHPYVAMYPPGGIYAHPSIPPGSYPFSPFPLTSSNGIPEVSTPMSVEVDCKQSEVKEKLPIKRCKGSLGNLNTLTGKINDINKMEGSSANGTYSKSAESRSEGSSEGSDANSQNDSQLNCGVGHDSLVEAEASQNGIHDLENGVSTTYAIVNHGITVGSIPASGTAGGVPGPTTNLNIGMDYWRAPSSSSSPVLAGKISSAPVPGPGAVSTGSRDSVQSQIWLQDERELKRQRRKQSNRESARRSRLRKQAECDELAQRADALTEENSALRSEVGRIRREYDELVSENASLKERLGIEESRDVDLLHHSAADHL